MTLLSIIEQDAVTAIHGDRHVTNAFEAEAYLRAIARDEFPIGVNTELHVHAAAVQDIARGIVEHATDEFRPDLIVMTAHGKDGTRRLIFGSIAQQVVAISRLPLLLVKPPRIERFELRNILVPLDNESMHDQAVPTAVELARVCGARLHLLCVIPTRGTDSGPHAAAGAMLPATAAAYLDIAEEMAYEHFQTHVQEVERTGTPVSVDIARGEPALMIAQTAEKIAADLILLATHGRAGLNAFWNRSVAALVARRTHVPLLLMPIN